MNKRGEKKRAVLLLAALSSAAFMCLAGYQAVRGFWDSEQAVHPNNASVENSTLFIGTHLIHLSAMTDELYETAVQSAGDSMQVNRYYKSELAKGTWFDITEASGLEDISTAGKPVSTKEIEQLFAEYHTKSDGITYDLKTGKPVNIYDIENPYEPEKLEELSALKTQLDLMQEKKTKEKDAAWFKKRVEQFFATQVQSEETKAIDKELNALYAYQTVLKKKKEGKDKTDVVEKVMSHVDADRRYEVFSTVSVAVNELMEDLNGVTEKKPEEYKTDSGLTDAVNESLSNVETALISWEGKALREGETVLSRTEYGMSKKLIEEAEKGDTAACDGTVQQLACLKSITDGVTSDREGELALLDNTLIKEAEKAYRRLLLAEEPKNAEEAVKRTKASEQEAKLGEASSELEFFQEARTRGLSNEEAEEYLGKQIQKAAGYAVGLPADSFGELARQSLENYKGWLSEKQQSLAAGAGGDEADKLETEREELKTEYMAALDNNDLALAKQLNEKIEELSEKLAAIEKERTEAVARLEKELEELKKALNGTDPNDERAVEAFNAQIVPKEEELARARAKLPAGSLGRQAADLKKEAQKLITENPSDADQKLLSEQAAALINLLPADYRTIFPLLKELLDAMKRQRDLNESNIYDSLIKQIEDVIAANRAAYDNAMRKSPSSAELLSLAEEFLGVEQGSFLEKNKSEDAGQGSSGAEGTGEGQESDGAEGDEETEKKQAVLLCALSLYGEASGNVSMDSLIKAQTQKAVLADNPLVYKELREPSAGYVSVRAAAAYTGMRYVWNETKYRAILAQRNLYYEFTAFSDRVKTEKEEVKMQGPARFQKLVYIPESFALEVFGCRGAAITGTGYQVIMDEAMWKEAEALSALLLEGGA